MTQDSHSAGYHVRIIPPFAALSPEFAAELNYDGPSQARKRLIVLYICAWEFDEDWYMTSNPDLAEAISSGIFRSGWHHFSSIGYFEGRSPTRIIVDNEWYMEQYEDVASAILDGVFLSARDHYEKLGRTEGRIPSNPGIDTEWYAKHYLDNAAAENADVQSCTEHFLRFGYLNGAVPAPPR